MEFLGTEDVPNLYVGLTCVTNGNISLNISVLFCNLTVSKVWGGGRPRGSEGGFIFIESK